MSENKTKYIHLLWHNELKFSLRLVQLINDVEAGFSIKDHVFVTPHEQIYEKLKTYENVVFDNTYGSKKSAAYINLYASKCDWLFVHSMCSPLEFLKIKQIYLHKIVHRTWGGDLGYDITSISGVKRFVKSIINVFYVRRMKRIRLIGVANFVDVLNVKEKIGNIATHIMPYSVKNGDKAILEVMKENRKIDQKLSIMIGHSGHMYNKHIEILNSLYRFYNEKIQIYLILSYGYPEYIEEVKTYGTKLYGDKITFIEDMLPYEQYVRFINDMDIAFFDGEISYALGNIYLLNVLRKKIFLNKNGVIRKAFDLEGLPYMCSSDLENMTFEEFSKPLEYSEDVKKKFVPISYENCIQTWHEIFNLLNN